MKVTLLAYTQNADAICAAAGNSCYSDRPSSEIVGDVDSAKMLSKIVGMGHHSVIEHASFTFCVEGVSRALTPVVPSVILLASILFPTCPQPHSL